MEKSKDEFLKYLNLVNALFIEVNPIPVKTAMNLMGMNVGECRPPLFPMDEKTTEALKQKLIECNLL